MKLWSTSNITGMHVVEKHWGTRNLFQNLPSFSSSKFDRILYVVCGYEYFFLAEKVPYRI